MPWITSILIAAGTSNRMGTSKPLLPWGTQKLIEHQIRTLDEAGADEIIVVLGHLADEVAPYVRGSSKLVTVTNPDYLKGKTSSIKCGILRADSRTTTYMLLAVDQPRTSPMIRELILEHHIKRSLITQPIAKGGKGGHPLLFDITLREDLLAITELNRGVREVLNSHANNINRVPTNSELPLVDINTKDEFERAKGLFHSSRSLSP
ncbi:MAG: nucleotidyltransferase family protein [SAR202 cluster bacterium]|nr:nucleotidyltransferase family protein [SAR202 cluster bacterium]